MTTVSSYAGITRPGMVQTLVAILKTFEMEICYHSIFTLPTARQDPIPESHGHLPRVFFGQTKKGLAFPQKTGCEPFFLW